LIRLVVYYFLFLFIFRVLVFIIKLFLRRPDKHREYNGVNEDYEESNKDKFNYENVVDAEFKEMK